jgi:hypothetical protein
MAIQQTAQADEFKRKLRDVLQRETLNGCAINIARHANVYATGVHARPRDINCVSDLVFHVHA